MIYLLKLSVRIGGSMTTDKAKKFSNMLQDRGFAPSTIIGYFDVIDKDSELDSAISFMEQNPSASKGDINYKIMQNYLLTRGVEI